MEIPTSTIPFFGRAWALTIIPKSGKMANNPILISSDTFGPEALRVEFEIDQLAFSAFWHAEFVIYNADGPITDGPQKGVDLYQAIIQEGDSVIFRAGYQADGPLLPSIWEGPIFYTIQDRVDVVDKRLIIHCLLNRALGTQSFLNDTLPARATQFLQAQFIASHAKIGINIDEDYIQGILPSNTTRGAQQLPRAKTYFGNPERYLTALANQNDLLSWLDNRTWNAASLKLPVADVVAVYAPIQLLDGSPRREGKVSLSLIGQPQQTNMGVNFRVLLDPVVQVSAPLIQVAIQKQYVRQFSIPYPPERNEFMILGLQDTYVVVGVRFTGDTRGNAWYTDIIGASQVNTAIMMSGSINAANFLAN